LWRGWYDVLVAPAGELTRHRRHVPTPAEEGVVGGVHQGGRAGVGQLDDTDENGVDQEQLGDARAQGGRPDL
jgi:hypothetical protein